MKRCELVLCRTKKCNRGPISGQFSPQRMYLTVSSSVEVTLVNQAGAGATADGFELNYKLHIGS